MKNINEKKIIQNIVDKTGDLSRYKMPQGLEIIKGIGDDAAYWKSGDFGYCVTSDTLVENVHFKLMNFSADKLGEKAVAVNLSDIAAMGANPMGMLINLGVTNDITEKWINDFYDGITKLALKYNCPVIGGDIVKSEILNISVTCIGYKKLNIKNKNIFLNRESVNPGDLVYVSGYLGNSKAGLEILNLLKTFTKFDILEGECVNIVLSEEFEYMETFQLTLSKMPGKNLKSDGFKYEPVFLFRKK